MTTHDPHEILSAFMDGESLEPAQLAEALASPGAREALLDFARIRAALSADESEPSPRFYVEVGSVLADVDRPWWRRRVCVPVPALAAAATVAAVVVTLFALRATEAVHVVQAPTPVATERAPTSNRVLQFERGVDWSEVQG